VESPPVEVIDCCEAELVRDCLDEVRVTRCREILGVELWATIPGMPGCEVAEGRRSPHPDTVASMDYTLQV